MNSPRKLMVDANILLRATFGEKVLRLLRRYEENVDFTRRMYCVQEALAKIYTRRSQRNENKFPESGRMCP